MGWRRWQERKDEHDFSREIIRGVQRAGHAIGAHPGRQQHEHADEYEGDDELVSGVESDLGGAIAAKSDFNSFRVHGECIHSVNHVFPRGDALRIFAQHSPGGIPCCLADRE